MVNFLTSMRTSVSCVYLFHTNINTIITMISIVLPRIVNVYYGNAHNKLRPSAFEIQMYIDIKLNSSGVLKYNVYPSSKLVTLNNPTLYIKTIT